MHKTELSCYIYRETDEKFGLVDEFWLYVAAAYFAAIMSVLSNFEMNGLTITMC